MVCDRFEMSRSQNTTVATVLGPHLFNMYQGALPLAKEQVLQT
jgi:hypothetical protein